MRYRTYCHHGFAILLWLTAMSTLYPAAACFASPARTASESIAGTAEIPAWQARWELARALGYMKRWDESAAQYRKVLQEKPYLIEAREEFARALLYQGKVEDGLAELARIPPAKVTDGTREVAADVYRTQKRYEKAEPLYRSILERTPDNHRVRLKLAEMLSWTKHYDESLAEYRIILAKLPRDIQVRRKYALVLLWAGRHAEAAQELRQTLP